MAARKNPKFNYAIICDDIRQEVGNKFSLIGIYLKEIIVSKFPITLPKLCFAIEYENIVGGDKFSIELTDPSGKRLGGLVEGEAPEKIEGYARFQINAAFSPLIAKDKGDYKLAIVINKDKKKKKEIIFSIKKAGE